MRQFHLIFTVFLFEPNFHFSLVVFFTCGILTLIFCFLFLIRFFYETVFSIHSLSFLGLGFFVANENSLNCTSRLVLLCFCTSSNKKIFALLHFTAFSTFCVKSFDFSRLVSLFCHSAQSPLNSSCSATQFKMKRVSIKNQSQK